MGNEYKVGDIIIDKFVVIGELGRITKIVDTKKGTQVWAIWQDNEESYLYKDLGYFKRLTKKELEELMIDEL